MKVLVTLVALALLCLAVWTSPVRTAWAQEDAQETPAESAGDDADEPADASDDIFLPSEEIQADSEISFPSDI